jgi:hypothetical protein
MNMMLRGFLSASICAILFSVFPSDAQTILPVVSVRATDPAATWSGDPGAFTVMVDGPTNRALTVFYRIGGSASNGVDYAKLEGRVEIPAGVRTRTIAVTPINLGQTNVRRAELVLYLPPTMIPPTYMLGREIAGVVSIYPSFNPPPLVKITAPTNNSSFEWGQPIILCAEARDESPGYVHRVEFYANNVRIGVATNNPLAMDPRNPFCVVWSNAPAGPAYLTAKAIDNDGASRISEPVFIRVGVLEPNVVSIRTEDATGSEPGDAHVVDPAIFVVSRTGPTNQALPVFLHLSGQARNGVDYKSVEPTVTIPAGAREARVVILPIDDLLAEGPESIIAAIQPPVCVMIYPPPPECYLVGTMKLAEARILDDEALGTNEAPVVRITSPANGMVFRSPVTLPLHAFAKDEDGWVSRLEFFANGTSLGLGENLSRGTNLVLTNYYVLIWTNALVGTNVLTAKATDNEGLSRVSEPVTIRVAPPVEPPPTNPVPLVAVTAIDPVAIEGTNCWVWPNPTNSPSWSNWFGGDRWRMVTNCGPKTATFMIKRTGATNESLRVAYRLGGTATNGVDYVQLPGVAVIPAGSRTALVPVVPIDDGVLDRDRTVVLELKAADQPGLYRIGFPPRAAASIIDSLRPRRMPGLTLDNLFRLTAAGPDGAWFRVEMSTDMVTWTPLGVNQVVNGEIHFLDPDSATAPSRFYRAVPELNPPQE